MCISKYLNDIFNKRQNLNMFSANLNQVILWGCFSVVLVGFGFFVCLCVWGFFVLLFNNEILNKSL